MWHVLTKLHGGESRNEVCGACLQLRLNQHIQFGDRGDRQSAEYQRHAAVNGLDRHEWLTDLWGCERKCSLIPLIKLIFIK